MISRWRWLFIYPLYLSFIYWSNLCKSNLYLRATEFLHTMEIQCSTWSQFSIIQSLVLQSSARIIHASGCFSFSQCLHFGCFAYCDFSPLEDQQWCNARCITLETSPSNFQFPAFNQINILVNDFTSDVTCFLCLTYFPIYSLMQISHMPGYKNQIAVFITPVLPWHGYYRLLTIPFF